MKGKWLVGLVIAVLVVGVIIAGCAPTPAEPTTPTEEEVTYIPLGTNSCLSGIFASWGLTEHWVQEMQIDDINEGGGCWGDIYGHEPGFRVNGKLYKWDLIAYDHKMDPTEAVKNAKRLVYEDNVKFMHIFIADAVIATRSITDEAECWLSCQAPGEGVVGPQWPRTFRFLQSDPDIQGPPYIEWWKGQGYDSWATISLTDSNSMFFHETYLQYLDEHDVEVTDSEYIEATAQDFTPQLSKMIASNPDLLVLIQPSSEYAGLLFKQARELGWKKPIFETVCPVYSTLIEICGSMEALEDFYHGSEAEVELPIQIWFKEEYTRRHPDEEWTPGLFDRADFPYMLTLAIEKAQSLDTTVVSDTLRSMRSPELKSFFGDPCWFGGENRWGINNNLVTRPCISWIHNGVIEYVAKLEPNPNY